MFSRIRIGDNKWARGILGFILLLFSLNILFLGIRMLKDSEKASFLHPLSPDDDLPRDFVQWFAAIVYPETGQYNVEAVRWIQLISYIVAGMVVLGIVGSCGGQRCINQAMGEWPWGAGDGAMYMARSGFAMAQPGVDFVKSSWPKKAPKVAPQM